MSPELTILIFVQFKEKTLIHKTPVKNPTLFTLRKGETSIKGSLRGKKNEPGIKVQATKKPFLMKGIP